ncbi:MerR family transcriptional regulator [Paenibacillus dendritiformis]|uniref:MerR family transcriptional regulator n=1 Tax=Paenibacillus dendritiformis TaxID=130049 RepID=UPI00248CA58D|nr:MerR family transcriptional regulator [Paenibacillus dendritiformis]WGU92150.1 MerR family transcriptional regulator [Paenibacillus dendritiformis]
MKIQEAADRLGLTTRAIRFYEQKGLLSPPKQEDNGYRVFREEDIERLRMIAALRELNLPLDQIRECLDGALEGRLAALRPYLNQQMQQLALQYTELQRLLGMLRRLLDIEDTEQEGEVIVSQLHHIGEQSQRYEKLRTEWRDRWNFDAQASRYDEAVANNTDSLRVHADYDSILDRVTREAAPRPGESGLELGVGTGNLAGRFLREGAAMTGIDQSDAMLEQCRGKYPAIRLLKGNLMAIPLADVAFDFIVSTYALHHLTDDQKEIAFEEMGRLLRSGGRIVIADLMFMDNEHRAAFLDELNARGDKASVEAVLDEYFADRSRLIRWLERHRYEVRAEQLNHLMHLLVIRKP